MKRLFIESQPTQTRTALTIDGRLREIYIDTDQNTSMVGQVIVGRLAAILPGQFAFVDIGAGKNALMNTNPQMQLKKGMPILVQVYKDPTGTKGAYVGTELKLKGRMVILFKNPQHSIGISQKIANEKERKRLRKLLAALLPKGFSVIVRTGAEGQTAENIKTEIASLHSLHEEIIRKAEYAKPSCVIYPKDESPLIEDMLFHDLFEIWISGENAHKIKEIINVTAPELASRIHIYNEERGLFDAYNISAQISAALKKTVQLPCGGFITIEQTEACVVIDVNTGRFTGQRDMRETVLKTNTEAAQNIAWQLALRNLSGIIIVDFIDMERKEDKNTLLDVLAEEIKKDRIKTELVGITELGLVQLTRRRTREPLGRVLGAVCSTCGTQNFFQQ